MRANDAVSGLLLILLGLAMAALTLRFPPFPGQNYGPALFPRIIAGWLAIGGGLLVVRGLDARRHGERWLTLEAWTRDRGAMARFLAVLAATLLYIAASDRLGFVPTAAIVMAGLFVLFGERLAVSLVVALATAAALQWFFAHVMRVPLPRGAFGLAF